MTMHGAVAPKDKGGVGLIGRIEFVAREDIHARRFKLPDVMFLRDRSKEGDSAHGGTVAQGSGISKWQYSPFALRFLPLAFPVGASEARMKIFRPRIMPSA